MILANLDCEAVWAGVTLPAGVRSLISAAGTLMRVFAEEGEPLWTPAPVAPERIPPDTGLPQPQLISGARPTDARVAWADADAGPVNHRRFGLQTASALGLALPGARMVSEIPSELDGAWVFKPPYSAAGRGTIRGAGAPDTTARRRIHKALATHGELLLEPWLERQADFGCCSGRAPHQLLVSADGAFGGIGHPAALSEAEDQTLRETLARVVQRLAQAGYQGPVTIDAFRHRDFHPLCEINARMTFGGVAAAIRDRLSLTGPSTLHVTREPPPSDAIVLLLPGPPDQLGAWLVS